MLIWSDVMINVFLQLLEEAYDNEKRSDPGFKRIFKPYTR